LTERSAPLRRGQTHEMPSNWLPIAWRRPLWPRWTCDHSNSSRRFALSQNASWPSANVPPRNNMGLGPGRHRRNDRASAGACSLTPIARRSITRTELTTNEQSVKICDIVWLVASERLYKYEQHRAQHRFRRSPARWSPQRATGASTSPPLVSGEESIGLLSLTLGDRDRAPAGNGFAGRSSGPSAASALDRLLIVHRRPLDAVLGESSGRSMQAGRRSTFNPSRAARPATSSGSPSLTYTVSAIHTIARRGHRRATWPRPRGPVRRVLTRA